MEEDCEIGRGAAHGYPSSDPEEVSTSRVRDAVYPVT